jgi:hypothetical protein
MFDSVINEITTLIIVIIACVATILYKLDKIEDAIRGKAKDKDSIV